MRHQFSFKESSSTSSIFGGRTLSGSGVTSAVKEDELNIDELLSTSNYIYLEEHHKFDSYDHIGPSYKNFRQPLSLIPRPSKQESGQVNTSKISFNFEETKEDNLRFQNFMQHNEDKENISLYSNMQENVTPTKSQRLRSIQSMPICTKSKYSDNF